MTINFLDLWQSLKSRRMLITRIAGAIFALIVVITFVQPKKYAGDSSLLIDLSQADQASENQPPPSSVIDSIIGTQESVLKSDLVVREVVLKSGLAIDPKDEKSVQEASTKLLADTKIDNDRQSNVITIEYMNSDRYLAAKVANLFVDVFIQKQVQLLASPAKGNARWYDLRTADVRERYAASQLRLSNFERAHGIIGVDRMDLEAEKLKALSAELATAEGDEANSKSKAGSANMPEVASALSVQGIEQQVANQSAQLQDLAKTLGPNHPQMLAAKAQLTELQSQLVAARSTQAQALSAASGASVRRVADLRARIDAQQQLMIRLSGVQDQLKVLQQDVDASKQTYDTVRQRFNDASLQGEISHANTTVLDRADAQILPAKPKVLLWLFGGAIVAAFTGVATALALELTSPRVRTANGLSAATELDVLADFSPDASGLSLFRSR